MKLQRINESHLDNLKTILIPTGLYGKDDLAIFDSLSGQLSDGMWENSPRMNKFWQYMDFVLDENDQVMIRIPRDYRWYFGWEVSPQWFKTWIANHLKQIVKEYIKYNDGEWSRDCTTQFNGWFHGSPEIKDVYRVYDKLLGRKDRIDKYIYLEDYEYNPDIDERKVDVLISWLFEHDSLYNKFCKDFDYHYDGLSGDEIHKPNYEAAIEWLHALGNEQAVADYTNYALRADKGLFETDTFLEDYVDNLANDIDKVIVAPNIANVKISDIKWNTWDELSEQLPEELYIKVNEDILDIEDKEEFDDEIYDYILDKTGFMMEEFNAQNLDGDSIIESSQLNENTTPDYNVIKIINVGDNIYPEKSDTIYRTRFQDPVSGYVSSDRLALYTSKKGFRVTTGSPHFYPTTIFFTSEDQGNSFLNKYFNQIVANGATWVDPTYKQSFILYKARLSELDRDRGLVELETSLGKCYIQEWRIEPAWYDNMHREAQLNGPDSFIESTDTNAKLNDMNDLENKIREVLERREDDDWHDGRPHLFEIIDADDRALEVDSDPFWVKRFDDDVVNFSTLKTYDRSLEELNDGRYVATFMISGGKNGSGDWVDYLSKLEDSFRELKEKTGCEPLLYNIDTDICDDLWTGYVFMYSHPEKSESLTESVHKLLTEGCWGMPYTLERVNKLKDLMQRPIDAFTVGDCANYNDELGIGDDTLFDNIADYRHKHKYGSKEANDVRKVIQKFIKDEVLPNWDSYSYSEPEGNHEGHTWEDGVKEVFQEIADMDLEKATKEWEKEKIIESKDTYKEYFDKLNNLKTREEVVDYLKSSTDWPEGIYYACEAGALTNSEYEKLFDKLDKVCEKFKVEFDGDEIADPDTFVEDIEKNKENIKTVYGPSWGIRSKKPFINAYKQKDYNVLCFYNKNDLILPDGSLNARPVQLTSVYKDHKLVRFLKEEDASAFLRNYTNKYSDFEPFYHKKPKVLRLVDKSRNIWYADNHFKDIEDFKRSYQEEPIYQVDANGDIRDANGNIYYNIEPDIYLESIEKHDTLNPKLFDGEKLKPEVKETVEKIAKEFLDELANDGIKFDLKDIILIGSNVSYNYNKDSDLDIHLIADSSNLTCPDNLYPLLYSAYRSMFNHNYDINIKGIPAEIYVEMDECNAMSNGIYSIKNGWVKKPVQQKVPDLDKEAFDKLFTEWEDRYFDLINNEEKKEKISEGKAFQTFIFLDEDEECIGEASTPSDVFNEVADNDDIIFVKVKETVNGSEEEMLLWERDVDTLDDLRTSLQGSADTDSFLEDLHPEIDLGWIGKGKRHLVDADTFTTKKAGDIITVHVSDDLPDLEYKVQDGDYLDDEAISDSFRRDALANYEPIEASTHQFNKELDQLVNDAVKAEIADTIKPEFKSEPNYIYSGGRAGSVPIAVHIEASNKRRIPAMYKDSKDAVIESTQSLSEENGEKFEVLEPELVLEAQEIIDALPSTQELIENGAETAWVPLSTPEKHADKGLYAVKNNNNGNLYIGKASDFEDRRKAHFIGREDDSPLLHSDIKGLRKKYNNTEEADKAVADNYSWCRLITLNDSDDLLRRICEYKAISEKYHTCRLVDDTDDYNHDKGGLGGSIFSYIKDSKRVYNEIARMLHAGKSEPEIINTLNNSKYYRDRGYKLKISSTVSDMNRSPSHYREVVDDYDKFINSDENKFRSSKDSKANLSIRSTTNDPDSSVAIYKLKNNRYRFFPSKTALYAYLHPTDKNPKNHTNRLDNVPNATFIPWRDVENRFKDSKTGEYLTRDYWRLLNSFKQGKPITREVAEKLLILAGLETKDSLALKNKRRLQRRKWRN